MPRRIGKTQLSAYLTDEAYERLQSFATENGSSMVAFLEALCLRLDPEKVPPFLRDVIRDARRIEADRRRRRRGET